MVLEGPWPWASLVVACVDDAAIDGIRASGIDGYLVDAVAEPGGGQALVVAAHRMLDLERFKPYAEQVGGGMCRRAERDRARQDDDDDRCESRGSANHACQCAEA